MICVGIDVAKDKHDCFILSSEGEVLADVFTIPQPTITLAEELLWNWIKNVFRSAGISRWC